jgi:flagellar basal-body rod protein FlgB
VYLFDLASRQAQWLSVRQATVAENVANANTPSYRTKEVEPFATTLQRTQLAMAASHPGHIAFAPSMQAKAIRGIPEVGPSGNSVSLEKELIKSGEVSRDHSLNVGVVKAFHRMWMAAVRS